MAQMHNRCWRRRFNNFADTCSTASWFPACSGSQYLFRSVAGAGKAPEQLCVRKGGAPFVGASIPCNHTIAATEYSALRGRDE